MLLPKDSVLYGTSLLYGAQVNWGYGVMAQLLIL